MADCNAKKVSHRNLTAKHVFVMSRIGPYKVGNFAEAKVTAEKKDPIQSVYMAPEMHRDPAIKDMRTDVWSLGMICYKLMHREFPFHESDNTALTKFLYSHEALGYIPITEDNGYSDKLNELVHKNFLVYDIKKR